jgi:hypothetical protein
LKKQKLVVPYLTNSIYSLNAIVEDTSYINQTDIQTIEILLDTRKFFGRGDFNQNPLAISPSAIKALTFLLTRIGDEDEEALLEILRTNPFLQEMNVNVDRMSENTFNHFSNERTQILSSQKLSSQELLEKLVKS